jgi:hypothetical protein
MTGNEGIFVVVAAELLSNSTLVLIFKAGKFSDTL